MEMSGQLHAPAVLPPEGLRNVIDCRGITLFRCLFRTSKTKSQQFHEHKTIFFSKRGRKLGPLLHTLSIKYLILNYRKCSCQYTYQQRLVCRVILRIIVKIKLSVPKTGIG